MFIPALYSLAYLVKFATIRKKEIGRNWRENFLISFCDWMSFLAILRFFDAQQNICKERLGLRSREMTKAGDLWCLYFAVGNI